MNTLPHIALFPAFAWVIQYFITGVSNTTLIATVGVILILWAIPMTWLAIKQDQEILK